MNGPDSDKGKSARQMLVDTVEAVGGVRPNPDGTYSPVGDPDWIDLADAYLSACQECGREPRIVEAEKEEVEAVCACSSTGSGSRAEWN